MVQNKILFLIVMLFSVQSCKIDRKGSVDRDRFTFKYTDDTYLFFRNVRQIYYDFQDLPKARWHAYRHSDRYQGHDRPMVTPVIVVDWAKDIATILIESNQVLEEEIRLLIVEHNIQTGTRYEYSLEERGRENMLEFATKIYEGILAEHEFFINTKNGMLPLFSGEEDKDNFRVVLADYYRLTRVF